MPFFKELRRAGRVSGYLLLFWLAAGIAAPQAAAQVFSTDLAQAGPGRIPDIRVEGAQRVDAETVRSYLTVRVGDPYDPEELNESLKSLFATGYFSDVTFGRDGNTLIVRVTENPIINRVAFEGNRRIEDATLSQEVQSKPRVVYTRTRVQNDVKRILDVYRRSGRFGANVVPKIIPLEQNRVDLVFEISEGEQTDIDRIVFIGNEQFDDGDLRSEIRTTESRWWRFLSSDDIYDPDRIALDRELLRKFYLREGYADFRVVSAVAELAPDGSAFILTFTLEEGERYRFGEIDLVSKLPDLQTDQLRPFVRPVTGEWYNSDLVEETVEALTEEIGRYGYAFVDVRPRVTRQRDDRMVDVTFEIGEGPRVYVDRIEIEGNVRTLDRVIRREFRLAEGDAFNTAKLRRSRQRLRNLGFFESVEVNNVPSDQPDRTTIKVEVQEQATGEISLGAGYSSTQGPLADIGIRERNLLGRGQDLRVGIQASGRQQQIDLSFTEPYFLERNLLAGFDLFHVVRDNSDESSFDLTTSGFSLRAGYRITESLSQRWRYTLRRDDIDPGSDASRFVRAEEGVDLTSAIGHELVYDKRDSRFDPTEGYSLSLSNEIAGLGGDVYYARTEIGGGHYLPLWDETVLGVSGRAGYIIGLGQDVGLNDRFQKGGDSFRGFSISGIGPRDVTTDDALGGNQYAIGTVELSFPLGLPEEYGFKGRVFSDFGTLSGIDDSGPEIDKASGLRVSVGVGVTWRSPFGPLRVDFGHPVVKEDVDEVDNVLFSFGTRF